MEALILAAASLAAWMLMSRHLFRYWVRNETLTTKDPTCKCGYRVIHKDWPCHASAPASRAEVAWWAILASLFFPVVLPVFLFIRFVMRNPPLSNRELAEKTRALEVENNRLRRLQGDA